MTSSTLLKAPFRPLYLLGAGVGIYLLIMSAFYLSGYIQLNSSRLSFALWHGHELIFGFAGAIVLGFILTALPSWAGARELDGQRLLALTTIWLLGRLAFLVETHLPLSLVAAIDCLPFIVASIMVARDLWHARNRWFLVVFLIFGGFWLGNLAFYFSLSQQDYPGASQAIRLTLYAIIFKFVMVGGFLTVVFSNNVMEERGLPLIRFWRPLEIIAIASIALMLAAQLIGVSNYLQAAISLFAFAVHLARLLNMRGWQVLDHPLLLMMNIAYSWMLCSFLLKAAAELGWLKEDLWLHAFTVGAMGVMMLSLMTRVALRHTGRTLSISGVQIGVFWLVMIAAVLRLLSSMLPPAALPVSALLFSAAFVLYLKLYGQMLYLPSLPKQKRKSSRA